jgi:hypothetical protein
LTLPTHVVHGLRRLHPDLAWAIVTLFERRSPDVLKPAPPAAELLTIADGRLLIGVRRKAFGRLPGVRMIPLDGERAFLALEAGRSFADLELAVIDRLESSIVSAQQRKVLSEFQAQLRKWRRARAFRFHSHAIIVVERLERRRSRIAARDGAFGGRSPAVTADDHEPRSAARRGSAAASRAGRRNPQTAR